MQVYLNEVTGIADAITSMYMSKRHWNRELEMDIRTTVRAVNNPDGCYWNRDPELMKIQGAQLYDKYEDWMNKLTNWCPVHITLGRFIDFSITVSGLHRGGRDDWDSHAERFDNRIIRDSTRMAKFGYELSDYYQGKIVPTDVALTMLGITAPESIETEDGTKFVKTTNGYIREDLVGHQDVERGLYMMSIPTDFIFKIDLTEWAHVYKERGDKGASHPEVKECAEKIADQLEKAQPWFTRELFNKIKN